MGELNIMFSGICVSLHSGVVPGVAMRTVLPNALSVRYGMVEIPGDADLPRKVEYYLMPHMATAKVSPLGGFLGNLTGQYFRVLNAKDQPFCRAPGGFSLNEFQPNVQLDYDVVFAGNALAYFDVFGGRVWTDQETDQHPATTHVVIKTHGTPRIGVWPLPNSMQPWEGDPVIETDTLYISNLDMESVSEDFQFDFLLNFLVARGGIPWRLSKRTPGMTGDPEELTTQRLGERLKALGTLIETGGTFAGWQTAVKEGNEPEPFVPLRITAPVSPWKETLVGKMAKGGIDPVPFDPSCSTSNYP